MIIRRERIHAVPPRLSRMKNFVLEITFMCVIRNEASKFTLMITVFFSSPRPALELVRDVLRPSSFLACLLCFSTPSRVCTRARPRCARTLTLVPACA